MSTSIDVTITAVRRPDLLERTLRSFAPFFAGADCRCIINVDPVGLDVSADSAVAVARQFFEEVSARMPRDASFPKAFKWCWQQADADFVFHLEDDWELLQPCNVGDLIDVFLADAAALPRLPLGGVRLPMVGADADSIKQWKSRFAWNGRFFECPPERAKNDGVSGNPTLFSSRFVRRAAALLPDDYNPEKAFHHIPAVIELVRLRRWGVFSAPNAPAFVRDTGEAWKREHGWKKAVRKDLFTVWERSPE